MCRDSLVTGWQADPFFIHSTTWPGKKPGSVTHGKSRKTAFVSRGKSQERFASSTNSALTLGLRSSIVLLTFANYLLVSQPQRVTDANGLLKECPPGHTAVGPECLPFSVTGGICDYPTQCLTGSLCMKGKCRGPCGKDMVLVDDKCVDYGHTLAYFLPLHCLCHNIQLRRGRMRRHLLHAGKVPTALPFVQVEYTLYKISARPEYALLQLRSAKGLLPVL